MYEVNYDDFQVDLEMDKNTDKVQLQLCHQIVGLAIMTRREQLGLSQRELAKKLSVPSSCIRRLERGKIKKRDGKVIEALANFLGNQ